MLRFNKVEGYGDVKNAIVRKNEVGRIKREEERERATDKGRNTREKQAYVTLEVIAHV
jgi:hypothetical protein